MLAQLDKHQRGAQEVQSSIPTKDKRLLNLFWSSQCKVLLLMLPTAYNEGKTRMKTFLCLQLTVCSLVSYGYKIYYYRPQ